MDRIKGSTQRGNGGMVAYFTKETKHSDGFAYTCGDGSKILVLAKALLCHCYDCKTQLPDIRMPPMKGIPEGPVITLKKNKV